MVAPRVINVEPAFSIGTWNNVGITIVHGHMDPAGVRRLGESYDGLRESYPQGIAAITLLRSSLAVGSKETNAEAQRLMAKLRGDMLHIAVVIENHGIVAQLLRSVIRSLNSVGRGTRLSIATSIEEATRVIAPHVATSSDSSAQQLQKELIQAIHAMIAELPPIERAQR